MNNLAEFSAFLVASRGDAAFIDPSRSGIERMEAEGQRALIQSAMIPKEIIGATREQLTEMGFKFGSDVDELFVACELPPGWTKRGTNHSMHSNLLDDQGRYRAEIFYKAAFYDRRADMSMLRRFDVNLYSEGSNKDYMRCIITDGDAVIFDAGEWKEGEYDHRDRMEAICNAWLNEKYPEWKSPLSYW